MNTERQQVSPQQLHAMRAHTRHVVNPRWFAYAAPDGADLGLADYAAGEVPPAAHAGGYTLLGRVDLDTGAILPSDEPTAAERAEQERMDLLALVLSALALGMQRYEGGDTNTGRMVRLAGFGLTNGMEAFDAAHTADYVRGLVSERYLGDTRGTQSDARGLHFAAMRAINALVYRAGPWSRTPIAEVKEALAEHVGVLTHESWTYNG